MISSNIEVLHDSDDLKIFKTTCQCSSEDHEISVIVEPLTKMARPSASLIFKCLVYPKTIWSRIKVAMCVLFKGYYDSEEEFMFRNDTHLTQFIHALNCAIKEVQDYQIENLR